MADKHPYITSGGPIIKMVRQFRKSLPPKIDAPTLKKLGLAPNNESYLISILRFLGVIDEKGGPISAAKKVLLQHDDNDFQRQFGELVKAAYSDLFATHGENAWTLGNDSLITFFRGSDETSAIVGRRQATTFSTLSALSGHQELPQLKETKTGTGRPAVPAKKKAVKAKVSSEKGKTVSKGEQQEPISSETPLGLSVRVEINLPADADRKTYDAIFQSIRENLLNAK